MKRTAACLILVSLAAPAALLSFAQNSRDTPGYAIMARLNASTCVNEFNEEKAAFGIGPGDPQGVLKNVALFLEGPNERMAQVVKEVQVYLGPNRPGPPDRQADAHNRYITCLYVARLTELGSAPATAAPASTTLMARKLQDVPSLLREPERVISEAKGELGKLGLGSACSDEYEQISPYMPVKARVVDSFADWMVSHARYPPEEKKELESYLTRHRPPDEIGGAYKLCIVRERLAVLAGAPSTVSLDPLAKELAGACSAERDAAITFARQQSRVDFQNMGTPGPLDRASEEAAKMDRAATLDYMARWMKGPAVNKLSEFHVCIANARLRQLGSAPEPERKNAFTGGTVASSPERLVECRALASERKLQGPARQEYLDDCMGVYSLKPPPAEETDAQATARGRALIAQFRPACEKDWVTEVEAQMHGLQKTRDEAARSVNALADNYALVLAQYGLADLARVERENNSEGFFYTACLFKQARLIR